MRKLLVILTLFPLLARASSPAGSIELAKGGVFILDVNAKVVADPEGKRGRTTKAGAPFYVGETVQTKADGRVKLKFIEGGNEVVLGAGTSLVIRKSGSNEKPGTDLALERGQIRSNVNRHYSGEGEDTYQVRTRNAVAGVRGTIFVASFTPATGQTAIITERGLVSVAAVQTPSAPTAGSTNAPVSSSTSSGGSTSASGSQSSGGTSGGTSSSSGASTSASTSSSSSSPAPAPVMGPSIDVAPGQVTTVDGARAPSAPAPIASRPELKKMAESIEGGPAKSSDSPKGGDAPKSGDSAKSTPKEKSETPLAREPVVASSDSGRTPASTDGSASGPAPAPKPAGGLMGESSAPPPPPVAATGVPTTISSQITNAASNVANQVNQARQADQARSAVGHVGFIVK